MADTTQGSQSEWDTGHKDPNPNGRQDIGTPNQVRYYPLIVAAIPPALLSMSFSMNENTAKSSLRIYFSALFARYVFVYTASSDAGKAR